MCTCKYIYANNLMKKGHGCEGEVKGAGGKGKKKKKTEKVHRQIMRSLAGLGEESGFILHTT